MDAFLIALFVCTSLALIILLWFSRSNPPISSVSRSQSGLPSPTNEPGRVAPFSLLASYKISDPGGTLIWSTQIPALRFVWEHEPQGTPCPDLKPIYTELARRYPEIYDGHDFHQWGQLLVDLDVFRVEAKCVHITRSGRALLEMLVAGMGRQAQELIQMD